MDAELRAELDNAIESLLATYQLALTYGYHETQYDQTYLNLIKELCYIEKDAIHCGTMLERAKAASRTVEEFEKFYNDLQQEKTEFDPLKSTTYTKFKQQFNKIKQKHENTTKLCDDVDNMILSDEICTLDPLTKQQIQHPVRNIICGHHYEKTSIMAIIMNKDQPQIKCPVAGCGNKHFITTKHLIEDNAFKLHLQQLAEER